MRQEAREEDDAETVEAVFAQARDAEAAGAEYVVDDGWKAIEVQPEAVEVNGNGHHAANGNGPSVELVLGTATPPTGRATRLSRATATATTTKPLRRSSRCSRGRSSWPRNRRSPRAGDGSPRPRRHPCSSGRSPWSRSGRRSRSARGDDRNATGGSHRLNEPVSERLNDVVPPHGFD